MHFADLHTHLIPGLDDGPASFAATLQMLKLAYESGTRAIVATPHMFLDLFPGNDIVRVNDAFAATVRELKTSSEQPEHRYIREMELALGSENYASLEFLDALQEGVVVPLNGSRYLLVEFSPFLPLGKIQFVAERILVSGYIPLIAHVERILAIQDKPSRSEVLTRMGCLLQANAESFLAPSPTRTRKTAHALAKSGLLHVIASDGHGPAWRLPTLTGAYEELQKKYDATELMTWLWTNPRIIMRNEALAP